MKKTLAVATGLTLMALSAFAQNSFDMIPLQINNVTLSNVVIGARASQATKTHVWGELEAIEVNYLTTGMTCNVRVDATNANWGDISTTLLFITNTAAGTSTLYRPRFPIQDCASGGGTDVLSLTNLPTKFIFVDSTILFWAANADLTNRNIRVKLIVRR